MRFKPFFSIVPLLAMASACGGGAASESAPPPATPADEQAMTPAAGTPAPAAPATFAEQVALGQEVFGKSCAGCHGNSGEGTGKGPAVVGLDKGALPLDPPPTAKGRTVKFETVANIADFVVKTMPPDSPGSLTADEYWAILAFDLKANGIDLGDKKLTPELASTLKVPR